MKVRLRSAAMLLFAVVTLSLGAVEKKVISIAWEWQNSPAEDLIRFQPQIAACGVDGVCFTVFAKGADGISYSTRTIVDGSNRWGKADFTPLVPKYREMLALPGLRDSWMESFRAPRKVHFDWRDDAIWDRVANNMRVQAWFAREIGAKGLFCDIEEYIHDFPQFTRNADDPEWDELVKLVRRRGYEVFKGVFEEYPDIRIAFAWLLSDFHELFTAADPEGVLKDRGLLRPHFVNGIVDAASWTCRLIDGNETGYEYWADREDYLRGAARIRTNAQTLIDPRNRGKFKAIMDVAAPLYMDMYVQTDAKSQWYKAPWLGTRLGAFQYDLAQAIESADEYVWLWGEHYRQIPWAKDYRRNSWVKPQTWDEMIPGGLTRVIHALRDPDGYAKEFFRTYDPAKNANAVVADRMEFWQDPNKWFPQGEYVAGVPATVTGSGNGCVLAPVDVRPGEIYAVRAKARLRGGYASAVVRWQNEKGWHYYLPASSFAFGEPGADGRAEGATVVSVPHGATKLVLVLGVRQQKDESCAFDDIVVTRVF